MLDSVELFAIVDCAIIDLVLVHRHKIFKSDTYMPTLSVKIIFKHRRLYFLLFSPQVVMTVQ